MNTTDVQVAGNQERYLLAEKFTQSTYQMPFAFRLKGVDVARLRSAIDGAVQAHPILRTDFFPSGTGFAARAARKAPALRELTLPDADPRELRRLLLETTFAKTSDLTAQNLVKLLLVDLGDGEHVLMVSLHHALSDAISIQLFIRDVAARYNGETPEVDGATYWDVIDETPTGVTVEAARAYWRETLSHVHEIPELPHDLERELDLVEQHPVTMPLDWPAVQRLAERCGVTPFVIGATLSQIVFARYCATQQSVLTFQSSGRKPYPSSKRVIGPFSNSLILTADTPPERGFQDLVRDQADGIKAAIANEVFPYHLVVRETGVQPKFGINWYPSTSPLRLDGVDVSPADAVHRLTNYDLDFRFVREGDGLDLVAWFDAGRHSRERIAAICEDLRIALARAADAPDCRLGDLFEFAPDLVVAPPTRLPTERLFDGFLRQARESPERVALLGEDWQMTYGEVEAASAALARRLIKAGLGPGSRIGILAERGPQLVWTYIAVLRIGATMVPLDSSYPDERLAVLLEVAEPHAVLMPSVGPVPEWAKAAPQLIVVNDPKAKPVAVGETPDAALAAGDPDDPAYILFTSGSTGTPKAIATSHRPPLNFLEWQRNKFGITRDDRFTNLNGVAHDMMIRDIFQPLSIGAQLAIPHQADIYRPGRLLEWLSNVYPTVTHMTPAMGHLLCMAAQPGTTLPLRLIFFGGDRLLPSLTSLLANLAPKATLVNFYGATETPQAAAFHVVDPNAAWHTHPIGRGIENMALRIVDGERRAAPAGVPGEIAVVTPFLSLGYVANGAITPHARPGVYFTGDMGFELPSGDVMFVGRRDDQVSIRGYRIELEEINRTLKELPRVTDAQVLVEGSGVTAKLVAFVAGSGLDVDDVYAGLARTLPGYMLPSEIVPLERLLLLPNGKIDRRGLLALPRPERGLARGRPPETATERKLVATWSKLLTVKNISPDHSFAQLHGDSLTYVQVMLATETVVGPLPDGWETLSIAEIAKRGEVKQSWFKWIDSVLLARAAAIVLVAALHLGAFSVGGGSTSALLLVSGYFVGRFQVSEAFRRATAEPLWRMFVRILVPVAIYSIAFFAIRRALGLPSSWAIPLFYSDFMDMTDPEYVRTEGLAVFLWYISALLHIILFMTIAVELATRFGKGRLGPKTFLGSLFVLGLVLRFGLPALIEPTFYSQGLQVQSALAHAPTTHLATYVLGAMLALASSARERVAYLFLVLAYSALTAAFMSTSGYALIAGFAILMLFVPQVPVPRGLHFIVLMLSGSSLFIYLTHLQFGGFLSALGVPKGSLVQVAGALAFGGFVWLIWQRFVASRLFRRTFGQAIASEA